MNQSLIVRQRVDMHQESASQNISSKTLKKISTFHPQVFKGKNIKKSSQRAKDLVCLVTIPRQVSEFFYIKASVELKLALSYFQDHCLGALKESPCTYNYRVSRTDLIDDVYFFTLECHDKANYEIDQIQKVLSQSGDEDAQLAIQCVKDRFKILKEYQKQKYISNQDLLEVEQIAHNYPYQCTIQRCNKDSSILSQRIVNEEFHKLLGISSDMMQHHLKETKTLPSIFDLGVSLKNWCELSIGSISQARQFYANINTYEGKQYRCLIEQRQMFKRTQVNQNNIVFIEFWIFRIDDYLRKQLMNDLRIYKNQIDYFNKKNTQEEHELFQKQLKYKETLKYVNSKPCGYRQAYWLENY